MQNQMLNCWPTHWLDAARKAGIVSGGDASTGQMFVVGGLRDQFAIFAAAIETAERERWESALRALLATKWCTPEYEQACRAAAALLKA